MGGLRSAAQMISYEVPQGLALVGPLMLAGTMSLVGIVEAQNNKGMWFVFPQIIAFFIYFVAGVAETNRNPFDLPEAESELVAGFHTEYSGMRFALFFLGEYANMMVISAVAVTLFFGGWLAPFPHSLPFLGMVPGPIWFFLKMSVFLFVYIWFRGTFPRYRFDQLMDLGWKWMLPLALFNLALTGAIKLLV
jgi:NADH-quinone oxidoreductase subunit H